MTKKREIIIEIDHETGDNTVEGMGFEGRMCDSFLKEFFAGDVVEDKKKPEYRQTVGTGAGTVRPGR